MNCRTCQERFSDYLTGAFSLGLVSEVEAHLADCSDCSTAFDVMRQEEEKITLALARLANQQPADRDIWPAIAAQLSKNQAGEEPRKQLGRSEPSVWEALVGWGLKLVPACAALLILSLALSFYTGQGDQLSAADLQTAQTTLVAGDNDPTPNDVIAWLTTPED